MKTFICNNCGVSVRRPTAPLRCEGCGQARIGLFRVGDGAAKPPAAPGPAAPAMPSAPQGEGRVAAAPPPPGGAIPVAPPPLPPVAPPAVAAAPPPAAPARPPAAAPPPAAPPAEPQVDWKRPTARPAGPPPAEQPPPAKQPPPKPAPREATPLPAAERPAPKQPPPRPREAAAPPKAESPKAEPKPAPASAPAAEPTKASAPKSSGGSRREPGTLAWKYPINPPGPNQPVRQPLRNCPIIDENGNIVAALGRVLVCLRDGADGPEKVWEYAVGGHIPGSPVFGRDGKIRVHAGDGELHFITVHGKQAFDAAAVGEPLGWAAPIADSEGNTYVSLYNGGLGKVESHGQYQKNAYFRSRQKLDSTGLIHKNTLYLGGEDAYVYALALDGSKGKNRWDQNAGHGKTDWFINSSPALTDDNLLIVAGRDEYLYAFKLDGTQAWRLHIRGQMLGSPVVGEKGEIYVGVSLEKRGDSRGKFVCVDASAPRIRWEIEVNKPIECTPVVGDDSAVYFGDNSGVIHAVNIDAQRLWSVNVGSAVRSAGTITNGRVVFGLDNGLLAAVACRANGLNLRGWPKYLADLQNRGQRS